MNVNTATRRCLGRGRHVRLASLLSLLLLGGTCAVAQSPAPADSPGDPADPESGDYEIGVEDQLRIHVWEDPDLKGGASFVVRPDGWISFPLVGEIRAQGRTPVELREEIRQRIAPFVPEATVTVIMEAVNSFKFYVLGDVASQGEFRVGSRLKILQAIALAGGLSEFADKDNIVLIRSTDGQDVRKRLNYKKILAGDPNHNIWIRPGDTIVVN